MLISKSMNSRLNEQVGNEMFASQTYLMMACAFDGMGLKVLSADFRRQTEEERTHALKIVDYMLNVGADVELPAIPAPPTSFKSVLAAAETALQHELKVTRQINDIATLAEKEKDHATRSFIQWFVDEQVEEVSSMTSLVQLAKLAGDNLLHIEEYLLRTKKEETEEEAG